MNKGPHTLYTNPPPPMLMPLPPYTATVAVRAAHAKCLQSGKFLIGAEIASGIDAMNGISSQPMGKFDMPPSPLFPSWRLVLKYR